MNGWPAVPFWRRRPRLNLHWVTDDIAIARQPADSDWPSIHKQGIRCVVDLRAETSGNDTVVEQHEFCYLRMPIPEGEAMSTEELQLTTAWIEEHLNEHGPVLVHCREGRGRSPMVVLAGLVRSGIPLAEGYRLLKRAHPAVALNTDQEAALIRFAESRAEIKEDGT